MISKKGTEQHAQIVPPFRVSDTAPSRNSLLRRGRCHPGDPDDGRRPILAIRKEIMEQLLRGGDPERLAALYRLRHRRQEALPVLAVLQEGQRLRGLERRRCPYRAQARWDDVWGLGGVDL